MSPSPVSVDKITRFGVYRWYLASRVICIYEIIHSLCYIYVLLIHSHVWNKCLCFYMQTELLWVFYLKQVSAWFIRSLSWRPWNSKRVLGGHVLLDIFNTFIVLLNFFNWMLIQLLLLKTESPRPAHSDLTAGGSSVWSYRHAEFWLTIMMLWINN